MRADRPVTSRVAARGLAVRAEEVRVSDPERRRGQRCEHGRMVGHGVGDALAALQPGDDQVPGVAAVTLGTRPADRLTSISARLAQQPVRLVVCRPHLPAAAVLVADLHAALQPDGALAVARGAKLRLKRPVVRPREAREHPVQQRTFQHGGGHRAASPSLAGSRHRTRSRPMTP
jgi:hypothetical protein